MIVLVDTSHLLHRCLSVPELANLSDSAGNTTGAIFGVLSSLSSLAEKYRYQCSFICAHDSGIPIHRRKMFKDYKPNKNFVKEEGLHIDDSLLSEINKQFIETGMTYDAETASFLEKYRFSRSILHNNILPYLGCLSIRINNCEADDIISVMVNKLKNEDEIVILSSDRDLDQLLDETVTRFDGIKKELITLDSIIEKYKLDIMNWRKHWLYRKALVGDGSDGIPGFYKLADKAAEYYSNEILKNDLKEFSSLTPAPRCPKEGLISLKANQERFWINYQLMDLNWIIDNNDPLYNKILNGVCQSNIIEPDPFVANQKLSELGMVRALSFAQNISDSNYNCPPKEYIKRFL